MAQTDPVNTFLNYVSMLNDSKDDLKLKAAQEISEHFEVIVQSSYYPSFLEHFLKTVIRILQETKPLFIQEHKLQHVRKLLLEMVHRLPITENLRQHVKPIISVMLTILRTDNEENVLIALRIIIELHKQFRPSFNPEVQLFLAYVKEIYADLPNRVSKIFEPLPQIHVSDLQESKFGEQLVEETYAIRSIQVENPTEAVSFANVCNLLPKGILSLRVLQELPIIVVLMYQIYKNAVHQEVSEYIPLIMTTINLQPTQSQRISPFFNKEIFIDFMGAQIKTLSFLAYIVRIYQDTVLTHSASVTNGMINLMQLCPKEAAHLRKELLIAARHIFATDLRQKFVPCIEKLFDEDILIGKGVTLDSIRPLAYSTLADLAHHVRQSLSLSVLEKAVILFSKNVHDDSLAIGIQTMSCKLLLNLVDCVRQHSEVDYAKTRQILTSLLKVFAYKFQTFTNRHLPSILQKWKQQTNLNTPSNQSNTSCDYKENDYSSIEAAKGTQLLLSNISEYRSLIKTLVGGVKTITWGFISSKCPHAESNSIDVKLFKPSELLIYIDMVYWALETLDIYTLNPVSQNHRSNPIPRTKEEKEVLEHFSGIFLMMHSQNFQEIFSTTIDFIVERINKNPSLQVIANSFLANPTTSPLFATVLVEYLLTRMQDMGTNVERSSLYLRLFKLVFGSVSLFPVDNEHMLRPHLHKIVNRSMELALTAEEPYNYFLLLRALFRSIGGGSHDLLYQEFLPLLPNLLEGLNRLQSGFHKQHMKDLFVELCLTVPVRLSSLLPYLPMLMDPLVSALNGSPTLISQGLRTLELCVDNLQPDFLYDHIQPVRASLMQALWKTLRSQDSAALVAFRVLGKFGGGNRKMMIEPQVLTYREFETSTTAIKTFFQEHDTPIDFPVDDIIETAFSALSSNATLPFYRRQCWEVIRCYLAASINLEDEKHILQKFFLHPTFTESNLVSYQSLQNKHEDIFAKKTHQVALTGMFFASATKDLRESVFPVMVAVIRYYTMIAIALQAGPMPYKQQSNIDPTVLIDALTVCMGHEEKELIKPGQLCIRLILDTSTNIMGSKERACKLPFIQYLAEKMSGLCYERPWYSKVGGCKAIRFIYQQIPSKSLYQHIFCFLKAIMFVLMDLENEVSNGAIDVAKSCLKDMLEIWMKSVNNDFKNDELAALHNKASHEVIHELVRQVTSPNYLVRNESMASLKYIAEFQNKTVTEIMDPHKEVLVDIIPPKKHLLRHQPANAQIGLMDGNTFCTTLEPRLFTINLNNSYHKLFFHELLTLSEAEDAILNKLDCYKNVTNLIPLRSSALYALAACHYISDNQYKDKIVNILFKVLESNKPELQEVAFKCMDQFTSGVQIDKDKIHTGMRPLLLTLGDHRNLSLSATRRLSYFTRLFPQMFNEKLSEQILHHCQEILKAFVSPAADTNYSSDENEKKIILLIEMFHQITAASAKYLENLCQLVLRAEEDLLIETSSRFREPLLKFLLRFPTETVDLFLSNNAMAKPQWNRFFIYLLKHKERQCFLDEVKKQKNINILKSRIDLYGSNNHFPDTAKYEMQRQSILIIYTVIEFDNQWISKQLDVVNELKMLWKTSLYTHCKENIVCDLWHLVGKILLVYFSNNTADIDLLYQLLRAFCYHFIPEFYFLRDFLQNTVANNFTVCWKRKAFFCFVEHFNNPSLSEDVKAKFITAVLIPCFIVSFDKGEGNKLIMGVQQSNNEDENVVSVFINKVFDPEKPFANDDAVRIALLQFACLLVERASQYIHDGDANNKTQGNKLRRLMTFAWPCLLSKNSVDPTARYHGHLLLSHIIARLAIHKKIVLQVFHSLLKGHALEAKPIVRQALDVLTPAMPLRMEDGNTMLTHWTKKIIVEEGHSMQQLIHILQLIVRHYKVYYPVRHHLIQHLVNYMQRLGLPPNASLDYKKLSVDIAEVIIKWELQHFKEEDTLVDLDGNLTDVETNVKRQCVGDSRESRKKPADHQNTPQGNSQNQKSEDNYSSIDKTNYENVLNFLLRLACQVSDSPHAMLSNAENLSRRCILLLKMALRPEWAHFYELRLNWLDKVFLAIETPHVNLMNICTGLDFLTFLMSILKSDQVLTIIRSIQKGLSYCIIHQSSRIVRQMNLFLTRLMTLFPPDSNLKHDDLELLYTNISKTIIDNMTLYEKSPQPNPTSLYGTLMILKAASVSNISYIDRIILQFIRVLNRLSKEHINMQNNSQVVNVSPENTHLSLELLTMSLDLIKSRVAVMGADIRKHFLGSILLNLIEKSLDVKVIKCIIKILDDWVKCKDQNINMQIPSIREKSVLLVKLMQNIDKKFADDNDVNVQFLELLNYIYRDEYLKQTELTAKLESGFLNGLRCHSPEIRATFFETLDSSMRRRLHDRLLYIICSQSWDAISTQFWIKQAIELLILTSNTMTQIQTWNDSHKVPSITSIINSAENQDSFVFYTSSKFESTKYIDEKDDAFDMDPFSDMIAEDKNESEKREIIHMKMINRQYEFIESSRKIRTDQFLVATSQLCHMSTSLAETVWISLFPRIWSIFDEDQQDIIMKEIIPFLASGSNVIQKDCIPSAINTFVEGLVRCDPPIFIPPYLMTYLAKAHNLWHRMTLSLEEMVFKGADSKNVPKPLGAPDQLGPDNISKNVNIYDSLSQMYSIMQEEDLWAGLWLKYAKYPETNIAIAYEQMGFFEEAQGVYDVAMMKFKQDTVNGYASSNISTEMMLWENHWVRCAKELNQWDILLEYAQTNKDKNILLILESAWRIPDWNLMKHALIRTEQTISKQYAYKLNIYKGFLAILYKDENQICNAERYIEVASGLCMREWRRLPPIVSHMHLQYLQAAQQIMELHEASQIHQGLLQSRNSSVHDIKAIVKTWRNRLPVIGDDLSHWSDILTWRQHHYQIITQYLEQQTDQTNTMLGVHASAQAIIHFGKMARKQNLTAVCQEILSRIYTIPSVPIVDCFQKIRQQVKCYLQMASIHGKTELNAALEVIESTNLKYFTAEMNAEFYALKGLLLSLTDRSDEAGKSFSAAIQLHDGLTKAWAMWGDYFEHLFLKDRQMILGVNALTCYLHACRHQSESKTRKYVAKILWLLAYDNNVGTLMDTLEKYVVGVPPSYWLIWIPQLLCCLVQYEGNVILNLLSHVGRLYPQAVYFPIRTLYLTLKIEQREKHKTAEQTGKNASLLESHVIPPMNSSSSTTVNPIKATPSMWRCSKVMHVQREIHPTILSSLEGIVDQMVWFRESWTEEVLRQLRQGLIKCYAIAFENRSSVNDATITPHTLHFMKKLGSTFGIGIENIPGVVSNTAASNSSASESLARRAQVTFQDPVFQKMKEQFTSDFDFSKPGAMKLHNLISKLKTWIKALELKVKKLPISFLIEDKCRFLSNFSQKTAEVELPGELLLPSSSHYHIRIARFMPRVEIVQKNNTAARRLYIRGTNGKVYPYLVVIDTGLGDARREERVLQLMRMLNYYLEKQKETTKRFLHMTVPRVVPISPQMRLAEDNPASISLHEIYKNCCINMKADHDVPIVKYYERLSEVQSRGTQTTHTVLCDIYSEIQSTMVSNKLLKNWAQQTFLNASDFWQFRKMLTLQIALASLCEYCFHLTRLNVDMMYFHQDSGLMNNSYFKFEINDEKEELDSNRPVPFRLTPNIAEFLTHFGITGPFSAAIIATTRCFVQPNYNICSILKTILRDEISSLQKRRIRDNKQLESGDDVMENNMENIINLVNKAESAIMKRLYSISNFENVEAKSISLLIQSAMNPDNLCRMDPAWHPWL